MKFTASARRDITHLEFTKSHTVVSSQTLQERSVTAKGTKKRRRKPGKHRSVKVDKDEEEVQCGLHPAEDAYIHTK